jgi:hypothetical protein
VKKVAFVCLLAFTLLAITYISARGTQWSTNFGYKNQTDMKDNGWTLTQPDGITFTQPGIILKGGTAVGVYSVPTGVFDWKVDVGGFWMGGDGHSWIDVHVNTERHTYIWVADGSRSKYVFYRDGVDTLHFDGYQESVNTVIDMTMHKIGNTIALYSNVITGARALLGNYVEVDTQLSRVTGVSISAPPSGSVKYVYAGGYVPEPSSNSVNTNPSTDLNPNQVYPEGDVPEPPLPSVETEPAPNAAIQDNPPPLTSTNPMIIVENQVSVTFGTNSPILEAPGTVIVNGVGNQNGVGVYDASQDLTNFQDSQQHLYESGEMAPETYPGRNPYGGWPVSYYVSINIHQSGENNNPNSVVLCTVTITDGEGNTVYSNQVSGRISLESGYYPVYIQGATIANNFLQGVVDSQKSK